MNKAVIGILALLAMLLAVAAVLSLNQRNEKLQALEQSEDLIQGVEDQLSDVTRIRLQRPGDTITLSKKGDQWTVGEKSEYWADKEKIKKIFMGFSEFETLEPKTAKPELYGRLGVTDPSEPDSRATRVVLEKDNGTQLANLIVGNVKTGYGIKQERYVRKNGDPQTWLVKTAINTEGSLTSWLDKNLMNVAPERVREIEIVRWDDDNLAIKRDSPTEEEYAVLGLPESAELKSPLAGSSVARTFAEVALQDVVPVSGLPENLTSETLTTLKTFDGLVLETKVMAAGERTYYAQFEASYNPSLRVEQQTAVDSGSEMAPEEDVQAEVQKINSTTAGWAYVLPEWKARQIIKPLSELYRIVEASVEEETAAVDGS